MTVAAQERFIQTMSENRSKVLADTGMMLFTRIELDQYHLLWTGQRLVPSPDHCMTSQAELNMSTARRHMNMVTQPRDQMSQ